jgi:hypothetical protein
LIDQLISIEKNSLSDFRSGDLFDSSSTTPHRGVRGAASGCTLLPAAGRPTRPLPLPGTLAFFPPKADRLLNPGKEGDALSSRGGQACTLPAGVADARGRKAAALHKQDSRSEGEVEGGCGTAGGRLGVFGGDYH